MKDFYLFIDTEASGLPRKWDRPYATPRNWPHAVQVSWIIFAKDGKRIKEQNYYVNNNDFKISPSAFHIHGLTKQFLQENGIPRSELLKILSADLLAFQPLIIGHFIEFDYHIVGVEYYREKMINPMENLPTFCIMKASQHLQQDHRSKFLRLGELYKLLFEKPLLLQHNALTDATATADCFFELLRRDQLNSLDQPQIELPKPAGRASLFGWIIALVLLLFILLIIAHYYG